MNRNALNSLLLATSAALSMFAAACGSGTESKPWAMRPITRDYTFPARDDEGKVIPEGVTVAAADLDKGRQLYIHYCYACHGLNGDGRGPASHGLRPAPRDLRMGLYKFDTVATGSLPNDIDFARIIKGGLHGTAMLKWDLKNDELYYLIQFLKTFPEPTCNAYTDTSPECLEKQAAYPDSSLEAGKASVWEAKVEKVTPSLKKVGVDVGQPKPTGAPIVMQHYDETGTVVVDAPEDPWVGKESEAVKKGEELYHFKLQCTTCHAHYLSRKAIYDYTVAREPNKAVSYRENMFYALPQKGAVELFGVATMPPDFTMNPIRSSRTGSELPDLYRLIAAGVGVMPSWAESATPEELWALVRYVKHLKDLQLPSNIAKRDEMKAMLHGDHFVPPAPKAEEPAAAPAEGAEKVEGEAKDSGAKDGDKKPDAKDGDKKPDAKKADAKKGKKAEKPVTK
ncbi:MAG: c-type cytochrome [Deltaproteobacteria bacterium]|nr:c-type cytochrome [Deltaproteobacteria bacterium]